MIAEKLARRSGPEGSAAIEFALLLPVLAIFLTVVAEAGFTLYQASRVSDAAEAGMLYAAKNGFNSDGISSAITNATSLANIQASPAPSQFCGCPNASGISTVDCTATCTGGVTPSQYIQVNAAFTRQSLFPSQSLGLPATLSATAIVRIN